ncbi:uncharacterized protein PFL1_00426 [Pseudozyma flocculosa PF-1]|uniref:uncharacterized protein n=1 Tax=Pseudozyma flocculosa PF-1 TaxID=1277687 RepID=UPI0004560AE5|nr:uncharacterized protein PFL1_00426 [Pseudozyma flocculosa PF-1]EPQ32229.1 hypothetical protein PFL1_00426 [Pseudozyma flocculosa PF-1]
MLFSHLINSASLLALTLFSLSDPLPARALPAADSPFLAPVDDLRHRSLRATLERRSPVSPSDIVKNIKNAIHPPANVLKLELFDQTFHVPLHIDDPAERDALEQFVSGKKAIGGEDLLKLDGLKRLDASSSSNAGNVVKANTIKAEDEPQRSTLAGQFGFVERSRNRHQEKVKNVEAQLAESTGDPKSKILAPLRQQLLQGLRENQEVTEALARETERLSRNLAKKQAKADRITKTQEAMARELARMVGRNGVAPPKRTSLASQTLGKLKALGKGQLADSKHGLPAQGGSVNLPRRTRFEDERSAARLRS